MQEMLFLTSVIFLGLGGAISMKLSENKEADKSRNDVREGNPQQLHSRDSGLDTGVSQCKFSLFLSLVHVLWYN